MFKNTYRLKIIGWRKIYQANENQTATTTKARVAILVSDKTDFNQQRSKTQEALQNGKGNDSTRRAILNTYVPNTGTPRFIKRVLETNRET